MVDKWFDEKFEKRNLKDDFRKYTKKRLNENNYFSKISRRFSVTNWLIIANVVVYLIILVLRISGLQEQIVLNIFALQASALFSGSVWQLFTSMFSHFLLYHLFFNAISLFFIGSFLERIIGRKKFFWFYIFSGLFAGIFYSSLSILFGGSELGSRIFVSPEVYSLGASGAVFGVAGLLSILTPHMKVYLIAGPIFALIIQSVLNSVFPASPILSLIDFLVIFYIFFSIFSMFSFNSRIRRFAIPLGMPFWVLPIIAIVPLVVVGLFVQLPIGNTAHLGGLIAGFIYGFYLKRKYKNKTKMISKHFS